MSPESCEMLWIYNKNIENLRLNGWTCQEIRWWFQTLVKISPWLCHALPKTGGHNPASKIPAMKVWCPLNFRQNHMVSHMVSHEPSACCNNCLVVSECWLIYILTLFSDDPEWSHQHRNSQCSFCHSYHSCTTMSQTFHHQLTKVFTCE